MASTEQQQTTKDARQDQEEEEPGDVLMDTEEELLRAEDTEQLKPEAVKSDPAAASGERLGQKRLESPRLSSSWTIVKSVLCSFLF